MFPLHYDPRLTSYEIERRQSAGRNPGTARRTSPQVIREALFREDLWSLFNRR